MNFEEYCYNATHDIPCVNGHCDPDAGCGEDPRQPPFAAITLKHVLDKVRRGILIFCVSSLTTEKCL